MSFMKSILRITPIVLILFSCSFARIGIKTQDTSVNLGLNVAGWMETGQLKSYFASSTTPQYNQWMQRTFLDIGLDASINDRIRVVGGIEGEMWLNTPKGGASSQQFYIWQYNSSFIVDQAYGSYSFGNPAQPFLTATAGRFRYKYNSDVRNLGEYLFRSGTYPAYLINNFDLPYARLTGLKLSSNFLHNAVNLDGLLTFETDVPPYYDASLSIIGSLDMHKLVKNIPLTLGVGVEFAHLISVDKNQTTPSDFRTKYGNGSDTGSYTFRGTKLMARMCFDPKEFIPTSLFGPEDCKLYAEAAILGLENYPGNDSMSLHQGNKWGYDTLSHKIPVVVGFNIPTFKFLDVFALEFEWYGCTYSNNYGMELGKGNDPSLPLPAYSGRQPVSYTLQDNWKWSVYAKKMFAKDHLGIIVQCARDHSRLQSQINEMQWWELEESMSRNSQWYWMTKIVAQF
jgi:hypothetical protein